MKKGNKTLETANGIEFIRLGDFTMSLSIINNGFWICGKSERTENKNHLKLI